MARSAGILPASFLASSLGPKPFRMRTYEKRARNPSRIRTSKTQDLKPFRMNTYGKIGEGVPVMVNQLSAAVRHLSLRLKAARFDFPPAISPPSLRPFPAHQLNLDSAPQSMRHPNQRPYRQIPRLILHRRNLRRAHFRLRRQFCLAQILRRPPPRHMISLTLDTYPVSFQYEERFAND